MIKLFLLAAVALLGAACTEPDLSTPEGRAEHARMQAVNARIWKDAWATWDNYPKPQPMMICSGYTSSSRYISGGNTTLVCQ
jgi:hypothetical protein